MRTRAERRKNNYKKAIRKKNISEQNYGFSSYDNVHQYSKNNINYYDDEIMFKNKHSHADKARIDSARSQLEEYED